MKAGHDRILTVDAGERTCRVESAGSECGRLGGKDLGVRILLERNPPGVDPLGPDNHLVFANGPLCGSPVWGSCRYGVFTKSPQTGFFSESYSGGTVSEYISRSGLDALVIRGAATRPVWLEVSPDGVRFHSAEELWGCDTYTTEESVKEWIRRNRPEAGRCGVLCIGPAGENGLVFAVIENDHWRSAGRTGAGAVMGSKRIKAIAFWGKGRNSLCDDERLKALSRKTVREFKNGPVVEAYKTHGTPMLVDMTNAAGAFPARYWSRGRSNHREQINAEALHRRCDVQPHACLKCFMACGRLSTVREGRHKGLVIEGPEYETIFAFGGLCEISSIEEIAYLNDLCDRLGMDTITAGNLAGLTIEAARRGNINHLIDYGQVDAVARLLEDMAYRRGIGGVLSRGIRHAAREWDMEPWAIHVKGLEPPGYDPRVLKGMGLSYGTSGRGACHLRATFYKPELSGMVDPEEIPGKAAVFAEWEDRMTLFDTLILCRFFRDLYSWEYLKEMIQAVTGNDHDMESMRAMASAVTDNVRRFNIREGLTPRDDGLPDRFHREPLPETGKVIERHQMEHMLKEYYRVRGWSETGEPPDRSR